jgi:L,D-transpeptidase catalytic domain
LRVTRRSFVGEAVVGLAGAASRPVVASEPRAASGPAGVGAVSPTLLHRALEALDRHRNSIDHRDAIGIADFSLHSRAPRFHLLNLADGTATSHFVAHGRGSDPTHTGWLERFSNEPRSQATSAGAYRTGTLYVGEHGRSMRLEGLDPTNDNAAARAIVVHGAWYVSEEIVTHFGMLGRSEGCLAVANSSLEEVLARLGPGRLIYADKA